MSASASVEKAVSSSILWACEELQLPAALAEDTQVALRLKLAGSIKKIYQIIQKIDWKKCRQLIQFILLAQSGGYYLK